MSRKRSELTAVISADSKGFSTAMKGLGGLAKTGAAAIGAAFAAVVAGGAGMAKFIGWLAETQKGMAEVNTIAGVSKQKLAELERGVFDLGAEFGNTTQDSIKGMYDALSAGVPAENVLDFLADASKLAIAGVTDVSTSVDVLTSVLNAYQLPASEAGRISDILFQTVAKGKTTLTELGPVISKMTPIASAMGISFEEVAAAMASITANGVKTAEAATQVRAIMKELAKPSKALADVMDSLNEKYGENVIQSLSMQEKLQLIRTEAEANGKQLTDLFGSIEAVTGALGMTGENAQRAQEHLGAVRESAGSTDKAFAQMADTVDHQLSRSMGSLRQVMNELGRDMLPLVVTGIKSFVSWVQQLRQNGDLVDWTAGGIKGMLAIVQAMREVVSFAQNILGGAFAKIVEQLSFSILTVKMTALATVTVIARAIESTINAVLTGIDNAVNLTIPSINKILALMNALSGTSFSEIGEIQVPQVQFTEGLDKALERSADTWQRTFDDMRNNNMASDEMFAQHRDHVGQIHQQTEDMKNMLGEWSDNVKNGVGQMPAPGSSGSGQGKPGTVTDGGAFADDPMSAPHVPGGDPLRENPLDTALSPLAESVAAITEDVKTIAHKVDKMAGLTGN